MKLRLLMFLTLLVALPIMLFAQHTSYVYDSVPGDPTKTRIYTLDNGLKVYLSVNKEAPRIYTNIAVRVGSKNDPAETTGLSHYLEHLLFKGTTSYGTMDYEAEKPLLDQIESQFEVYRTLTDTDQRKAAYAIIDSLSYEASKIFIPNEYDKLMSAIGATGTNAYTSSDATVYVNEIPSNEIGNWLKIESDRFQDMVIRGFHTELEAVYEELNKNATNDNRKVFNALLASLFPDHTYGTQTTIGTREHLKNPSIINIKRHFDYWYRPNNMAVVMAGDFDPDATIVLIDKYFGAMKPNPEIKYLDAPLLTPLTSIVEKEVVGLESPSVYLAWRMNNMRTDDQYLAAMVANILYNSKAGLIDTNLNQTQKVLIGYAFPLDMADYGLLAMGGSPKSGQTLEEVRELLLAELDKVRRGEFDADLITATVNNSKLQVADQLDTNEGRVGLITTGFGQGLDWETMLHVNDRMAKITKEDIVRFVNEKVGTDNYAVIYKREGKDTTDVKIEKPAITPILMNRDDASTFLTEVRNSTVPEIEPVFVDFDRDMAKQTIRKGIELLYKKNETTEKFSLIYLFEGGTENDPMRPMAFEYMEYLGTGTRTLTEINLELYKLGCNMMFSTSGTRSYIVLSGLSDNMTKAMEILEDRMANSMGNEQVLANLKEDTFQWRANDKLDQRSNLQVMRRFLSYGEDYVRRITLDNDRIASLTSEELLDQIRSLNSQEHRILYYGPKKIEDVAADIKANHKTANKLTRPDVKISTPLPTPNNSVYIAEYDADQLYMYQFSNLERSFDVQKDAIIGMYNEYFGGGMNSIVFQEMREARALAYTATARLATPGQLKAPYTFYALIGTQNDKLGDAMDAFEEIINNMPQSQAAFEIAKDAIISKLRTERITKANVLWSYISAQDLGLSTDRRKMIFETVQALTLGDVAEFQKKWIKDRTYTYGILGRSEELNLEKLGKIAPIKRVTQEEMFGY